MRGVGLGDRVAPLSPLQVDVGPLGRAQLPGSHEDQRSQAQGASHWQRSPVAVQHPQQRADLLRIGDGGQMLALGRRQGAAQVPRWVPLGPSGSHRIAPHPPTDLQRVVGHLQGAAFFDPSHHGQQLRCLELGNRFGSDPGKDIAFQLAANPVGMTCGPVRRVLREPFPAHGFETVPCPLAFRLLLSLPVGARVDVLGQKLPGLVTPLPGQFQRHVGIESKGDAFLLVGEAILEAPGLAAAWGDLQIQTAAVVEFAGLVAGTG